jgi:hypothetical protein
MLNQRPKSERQTRGHYAACCAMFGTLTLFALAILASTASSIPIRQANNPSVGHDPINVRLLVDKHTFVVGEPINLKVEVSNQSSESIVVANDISTVSGSESNIKFELTDPAGHVSPMV